ncbi:hypothetical protein GLW08_10480 [Pontibacillus yanchengensis]|uniref:Uncharacterized protein n=1 Tax=Pontibacillus yanchengensis TaxID=462910 RepID=A0ACC7VG58_9BACI|nr:hypothetical protein [Pontibacillus yanchengensis]MYL53762.1 hypothetical protein [Pontibacillus yanchengensis]
MDVSGKAEFDSVDNYDLEDSEGNDIPLEDVKVDGSDVWLVVDTSEETVDQQTDATLTVSDMVLEEEKEFDVQFQDTTIPTAEDASVIGIRTAKVSFSEPIVDNGNLDDGFELEDEDGSTYSIDEVELQNGGTEARVTFFSDFEDGTYTLSTTNELEDYAGYSVTPESFDIEVEADDEAPELEGTRNATQTKVTLEYSEDIEFDGIDESVVYHSDVADSIEADADAVEDNDFLKNFYHTNSSNTPYKAEVNGKEITLWFDNDHALPEGTAYLYVGGETVTDLWENVQEDTERVSTEVELDEEAPSIDNIEQVNNSQDKFEITFSEEVSTDSAEDLDNYTVENADGEEVELDGATLGGDNTVTLEFEDSQEGNFTVSVDGVEDLSGNSVDQTSEFNMKNVANLVISEFSGSYYQETDETTVAIDFGRTMAVEGQYSVTDLDKYEIGGVNLGDVSGANIEAVNSNNGVEINFDNDDFTDAGGNLPESIESNLDDDDAQEVLVDMGRVADADDNKSDFTGDFQIENGLESTFGADLIEATSNDEITVDFSQTLDDFDREDFKLVGDDDKTIDGLTISQATKTDDNTVVFELSDNLNDDATFDSGDGKTSVYLSTYTKKDGQDYNVKTDNRYGTEVALDKADVTDGIAPSLDQRTNDDDEEVTNVEYFSDQGEVVLTFNENIKDSSVSTTSFTVDGYNVDDVAVDGNEVTLVIDSADIDDDLGMGVDIEQNAAITDDKGNKVTGIDTQINFENDDDTTAPNGVSEATTASQKEGSTSVATVNITDEDADFEGVDHYNVFVEAGSEPGTDVDTDSYATVNSTGETDIDLTSLTNGEVNPTDSEDVNFKVVAYDAAGNASTPQSNDMVTVVWDENGEGIASTAITQNSATNQMLSDDKEFTVTLSGDYDGAYGNNIDVVLTSSSNGTGQPSASASFSGSTLTIDQNSDNAGTVQDLIDAVDSVSGFTAAVSGNGVATTSLTGSETEVAGTTATDGGNDSVTVNLDEVYASSTVDSDSTVDFAINDGSSVTFTSTTDETDEDTLTLNITDAGAQVNGANLNIKDGEITDQYGNNLSTTATPIN